MYYVWSVQSPDGEELRRAWTFEGERRVGLSLGVREPRRSLAGKPAVAASPIRVCAFPESVALHLHRLVSNLILCIRDDGALEFLFTLFASQDTHEFAPDSLLLKSLKVELALGADLNHFWISNLVQFNFGYPMTETEKGESFN